MIKFVRWNILFKKQISLCHQVFYYRENLICIIQTHKDKLNIYEALHARSLSQPTVSLPIPAVKNLFWKCWNFMGSWCGFKFVWSFMRGVNPLLKGSSVEKCGFSSGTPCWRGKLCTVDLLVKIACSVNVSKYLLSVLTGADLGWML